MSAARSEFRCRHPPFQDGYCRTSGMAPPVVPGAALSVFTDEPGAVRSMPSGSPGVGAVVLAPADTCVVILGSFCPDPAIQTLDSRSCPLVVSTRYEAFP